MIEISIDIIKSNVYDEVAKTTSYTGAKMDGDGRAYERIFTTDEDQQMLERFWDEAANAVTEQLKPFIKTLVTGGVNGSDGQVGYHATLSLSSAFDETLSDSIESGLFSFFVNAIVSKWYKFTNKGEADAYATDAAGMMDDVMRKVYYRKKPQRVKPTPRR